MTEIKYIHPEDHIVDEKRIKAGTDRAHLVRLIYYPPEYDVINDEKIETKKGEWQVEVDVGAFFHESYHENEKSARWSYDLINENFIASVVAWHKMRSDADNYRYKILEIHYQKVFNGRPQDE